jgi:hypothetical protein
MKQYPLAAVVWYLHQKYPGNAAVAKFTDDR